MATTTLEKSKPEIRQTETYEAARYGYAYSAFLFPAATVLADAHTAIVEALERGDPEAAERAIHRYLRGNSDRFAEVIESVGERGTW